MNSKNGEWKLVKRLVKIQFSQLVSAMAIFKGICSRLSTKMVYRKIILRSLLFKFFPGHSKW